MQVWEVTDLVHRSNKNGPQRGPKPGKWYWLHWKQRRLEAKKVKSAKLEAEKAAAARAEPRKMALAKLKAEKAAAEKAVDTYRVAVDESGSLTLRFG